MDAWEISTPSRKHAIPDQETESSLSVSLAVCVTGFKQVNRVECYEGHSDLKASIVKFPQTARLGKWGAAKPHVRWLYANK